MAVPTIALRDAIRRLLNPHSPGDALACYYALYHDPGRTEIFVYPENSGRPEGFLVRARTGHDLFRPPGHFSRSGESRRARPVPEGITIRPAAG